MPVVGSPRRRVEGRVKVTGALAFTADLPIPNAAHARLVLSPHPAARITAYQLDDARAVPGVLAVVTGADLPELPGVPGADLPLARGRVFFAGQPVLAVVGKTEAAAADGAARVQVDYEPLPAVFDALEAVAEGAPRVLGESEMGLDDAGAHGTNVAVAETADRHHNVSGQVFFKNGDVDAALAGSAHVVKGRWRLASVHQGFLETHVSAARPEPDGTLTIWTSTQGGFFTRRETARVLGLPQSRIRVVPMPVGGGFGGKICLLEPLVGALARHLGRPVRCQLTRHEEFLMGRAAPGAVVDLELGADTEGRLTGLRSKVWFDNGAGAGGLAGLAGLFLCSAYRLGAYDFAGYDVATTKTPVGAYRAPGAPQAFYALECAVDELAEKLGQDPIDFRLRNAAREGDPRPDGTAWPQIGLIECLERARRHPLYTKPNVGVAVGAWGGGREPAAAACRVEPDGTLALHVGYVDISGTDTTMAMIAAEAFGVALDKVRVETSDTATAPYAGMAGGSKTVYTVGPAVQQAAAEARKQLLDIAAAELEAAPEDLVIEDGHVQVSGVPSRRLEVGHLAGLAAQFGGKYPPVLGQGRAAVTQQSPMFTVHLCRVEADPETGRWGVAEYAAIQDVGKAINPPEVIGQVHGGVLQGLGRALGEAMEYEAGVLRSASFLDYELPAIDQAPEIEVDLVEIPSPYGPYGAKGVGEPPAVPGPAAAANALRRATGWRPEAVPVSWEQLAAESRRPAPAGT
ncbi:MAG TPA: xanthine dehydrogenase family protein molybdopterin-binding subunit [Candidatus Dormibacteraeota bacterium]